MTGLPISFNDLRVIHFLMSGSSAVGGVAAALDVDISRASRQIAQLEELGQVVRLVDPMDARGRIVQITPEGRETMNRWRAAWENDYLEVLAEWDRAEAEHFMRLIERYHVTMLRRNLRISDSGSAGDPADESGVLLQAVREDLPATDDRSWALPLFRYVTWVNAMMAETQPTSLVQRSRSPIGEPLIRVLSLVAARGPLRIQALAERTGVAPSRSSRHVQQLEDLQMVSRALDPHDRRSSLVKVTPRGIRLLRRIRAAAETGTAEALADWDRTDVEMLAAYSTRLLDGMRARSERRRNAEASSDSA